MAEDRESQDWFVYMIQTVCDKYYTGIARDVDRRFAEHKAVYLREGTKGAKYFRAHEPDKVVYRKSCVSRSEASKLEYQIKKMGRAQKERMLREGT